MERKMHELAERIYNEVGGGDNKYNELQGRIEDWLNDGDLSDNPSLEQLVAEWREHDQDEIETDDDNRSPEEIAIHLAAQRARWGEGD